MVNVSKLVGRAQFSQNFIKFFLYWIALVATCTITFVTSASHLTVKPLQFQAPAITTQDKFPSDITLTAEAVSVDPIARTMVMNWYPDFTGPINCSNPLVADIYIPTTYLDAASPSWNGPLDNNPAFRMNGTEYCLNLTPTYQSFRTLTKLVASKENIRVQSFYKQANFQSYPFDEYLAPFLFYTKVVGAGPIKSVEISDSFGIAVNFEIELLNSLVSLSDLGQSLQLTLRIQRSVGTKMFVVMVAVTNWLTATAFLTICAATCVYQPHKIYAEIFVVPIGALFAFSSIRSNLPGAPDGFGATIGYLVHLNKGNEHANKTEYLADVYTILPVLVIMSLCSFSLLLTILYRRIRQEMDVQILHDPERNYLPNEEEIPAAPITSQLKYAIADVQAHSSFTSATQTEQPTLCPTTIDVEAEVQLQDRMGNAQHAVEKSFVEHAAVGYLGQTSAAGFGEAQRRA